MTKHSADEFLQANNFEQSSSSGVNSANKCGAKLSSREKNVFPICQGLVVVVAAQAKTTFMLLLLDLIVVQKNRK